ncbi:MAG: gamma-glutamyl-gamma-aminobutyrate hydrolase family protein [Dehalococcoidia bacterium]|nr:gamma-glutamyl-gamma-aminobutyrate hydrolase family protein [Dehalococcoidia bacterium]
MPFLVIGVAQSAKRSRKAGQSVAWKYHDATQACVRAAGLPGETRVLPLPEGLPPDAGAASGSAFERAVRDALRGLSGLLLTGGADVDPRFYGESPDPEAGLHVDTEGRDAFEIALVRAALDRGLPVLAVCRGMQVLNVALGGNLVQHIGGHQNTRHVLTLRPASFLAELLASGTPIETNSYHHQALKAVAPGLIVTARAPDGTVEAVDGVGLPGWVHGVQFHPEKMGDHPDGHPARELYRRIFAAFVEAAAGKS